MGEERKKLYLASWGERLVAWLIDVILVGGISTILLLYVGRLIPLAWWERPQIFWFPRRMASPPYPPLFLLVPFVLFTPWFHRDRGGGAPSSSTGLYVRGWVGNPSGRGSWV
jgi:hypothetical protein